MSTLPYALARLMLLSTLALASAQAGAQSADASLTPPPAPRYDSAFTGYQAQQNAPQLPWKDLFNADGSFANTTQTAALEVTVRKPTGDHHGAHSTGRSVTLEEPVQVAQAAPSPSTPAQAAPASDTHGRIESINKAEGKVKLKHGPIPKFDMPGMTMVFRVQDPKLLDQVKVGDEVGVTMQMTGGAIVITGFQK